MQQGERPSTSVHPRPPCQPPTLTNDVDHWQYNTYFTWIRYDYETMQKLCDIRVQMEGNPHKGRCTDNLVKHKHCWTTAECSKFRNLYEAAFFEKRKPDWEALKKDDDQIHVIWSHMNIVLGRYPRLSEVNRIFKSVFRIWGCSVPIVSKEGEELRDMNDIRIRLLITTMPSSGDERGGKGVDRGGVVANTPTTSSKKLQKTKTSTDAVMMMPLVDIGQRSKCYYIWVSFEEKDNGKQQAYLQIYTINFSRPAALTACKTAVSLVNDHLSAYRPRKNSQQPSTPLSVSAANIGIHVVTEDPSEQAGGDDLPAVSVDKKQPCPGGGYSVGFQFDKLDPGTTLRLCDIRASMHGNPSSKCAASVTDGVDKCWNADEVSRFKELYYDKIVATPAANAHARRYVNAQAFWKRLPRSKEMPAFWSHLNVVLGRYPTPSELKTMFPDGAIRIWQFSAELFSREPLTGPGLTDIRLRHLVTIPVVAAFSEKASKKSLLNSVQEGNVENSRNNESYAKSSISALSGRNKKNSSFPSPKEVLPLVQIGQQTKCFRLWVHVVEVGGTTRAFMSMYTTAYRKKTAFQAFETAIALVNEHAATYAPRKPLQPNAPLQILNLPEPHPYNMADADFSKDMMRDDDDLPLPIHEDTLLGELAQPSRFPKLPMPNTLSTKSAMR